MCIYTQLYGEYTFTPLFQTRISSAAFGAEHLPAEGDGLRSEPKVGRPGPKGGSMDGSTTWIMDEIVDL